MAMERQNAVLVIFCCCLCHLWLQCCSEEVAPVIVSSSSDIVVRAGGNVRLLCKAAGHPAPEIRWYYHTANGGTKQLTSSTTETPGKAAKQEEMVNVKGKRRKLDTTRSELALNNMKWDEGGEYECIADNDHLQVATKQIKVSVKFSPVITMRHCSKQEGSKTFVTIECEVNAYPDPNIYWEKDGMLLVGNSRYPIETKINYGHEYTILMKMQFIKQSQDAGVFTCYARNQLGRAHKNVIIAGAYEASGDPGAPAPVIQRDAMAVRANPGGSSSSRGDLDIAKIAGGGGAALFIALVALVAVVVTMNRKRGTTSNLELTTIGPQSVAELPTRRTKSQDVQGPNLPDEQPLRPKHNRRNEKPFSQPQYQAGHPSSRPE